MKEDHEAYFERQWRAYVLWWAEMHKAGYETEDLLQEARLTVWQAREAYRPGPVSLKTWVKRRLDKALLNWMARHCLQCGGGKNQGWKAEREIALLRGLCGKTPITEAVPGEAYCKLTGWEPEEEDA